MFVTYTENPCVAHGNSVHNGSTVSVITKLGGDHYVVNRHLSSGQLVEWIAHVSELNGFDGVSA